jgi:hypothetical protein
MTIKITTASVLLCVMMTSLLTAAQEPGGLRGDPEAIDDARASIALIAISRTRFST